MNDSRRLVNAARRLSETLTPGDLEHLLQRIAKAAIEVLPNVDHASITLRQPDGQLVTIAATDPMLTQLDAAQQELGEGPWFDDGDPDMPISARDLVEDGRFPRYAERALAQGIVAQATMRLYDAVDSRAMLNLYSCSAGAFDDLGDLGDLFNDHTMMAIAYAREIDDRAKAAQQRELVGLGVGMAMERYELSHSQAFAFLTRLAQRLGVQLPEAAAVLVETSEAHGAEYAS